MIRENYIDSNILEGICADLDSDRPINEVLPKNGILHIDKLLPFICIYRFDKIDVYFSRLIKTQASYIIADETLNLSHLIEAIRLIMEKKFEAFLILEFWPDNNPDATEFKIFCPKVKDPGTLNALQKGFESLNSAYPNISCRMEVEKMRHPKHLEPLLNDRASKKTGTLILGIMVPVIYKNSKTNELYSLFFREFYTVFSETVKRAAYEFIRIQNADDFKNYLMLGKTHVDAITRQADEDLASISSDMYFLLRTTPVNSNEEWEKFVKNDFKKEPSFKYRLIALDPELKKRKLYEIPIDKIEDPTIAFILRGKRLEIEKQLIMLEERGTENFLHLSKSLYGSIQPDVLEAAEKILTTYPKASSALQGKRYNSYQFAQYAQEELDYYSEKFPDMELKIEIRDDIAGIMVSKSKLLMNDQMTLDTRRCDALIQHEISTHILTYCNGKQQPLQQMYEGFEGYDQFQEGIAVVTEYLVGGLTVNRLRLLAGRVMAVNAMISGATFIETFQLLNRNYGFSEYVAFNTAMRVYRGGGLTKDAVYLAGVLDVLKYLKQGGALETLYTGKFNVHHIKIIEELLSRKVLKAPVLPRFLEREAVRVRLNRLRKNVEITELIN
ncbi:flavohemoglobin expression-modulating QEGLA motif protein [Pseudotamlana agarivorans]|uniref:flavohemoglobin expression-modulating QEGLA motif protein n=1 Tax=Pseudotamlana agarivorans TaxID=481183 RepID=UPI00082CC402|nr:tyrosine/phenylalanine carboxypeptidase domain-containing protein [Tamlana agarivorans]